MASADNLRGLIKPPFANYDVVVYFGCGLFSLPLIFRYVIEPFELSFPSFQFEIGIPFADSAISTLSLLFSVYILGHMIAYVGSMSIEKSVDLVFGKVSSALLLHNATSQANRDAAIKKWISRQLKKAFQPDRWHKSVFRIGCLLPAWPALLFIYLTRSFGYFKSRVSRPIIKKIRAKSKKLDFGTIAIHLPWYKAVEHHVINSNPLATARMYNYLVIGGIFRSLATLFLFCAWAELFFFLSFLAGADYQVHALLGNAAWGYGHLFGVAIFNLLFAFSLSSYFKFSRRYVEEAVFAFAYD